MFNHLLSAGPSEPDLYVFLKKNPNIFVLELFLRYYLDNVIDFVVFDCERCVIVIDFLETNVHMMAVKKCFDEY